MSEVFSFKFGTDAAIPVQLDSGTSLLAFGQMGMRGPTGPSGSEIPVFADLAGMKLSENLEDGGLYTASSAFNGEPETFRYDAGSTATADGALIVDATGMGAGRLVSTRTAYADFAEMDADARGLAEGTALRWGIFDYTVAASGATDHHITTAGGAKFYVTAIDGALHISAFGASASNAVTANDTALQKACAALSAGDELRCDVMGVVKFSDATIGENNVTVNIVRGCELQQDNAVLAAHALKITGNNVTITGGGTISSEVNQLSDYATTGTGIARSIIHITGDSPTAQGIEIKTPSRCGVFFDGCLNPTLTRCWGNGGYELSDYDSSTTLNLYAAYYNCDGATPETSVYDASENKFQQYITPISGAALSSGSFTPSLTNNVIRDCWDHAFYLKACVGGNVTDNSTYDTRLPAAVEMNGVTYARNNHHWSGTTGDNMEAGLSMRDMRNGASCEDNTLVGGRGGYIDCRPVSETYDSDGISVSRNTSKPAAASTLSLQSIRVENTSGDLTGAKVLGNRLTSEYSGGNAVIRVAGRAGTPAITPVINGNYLKLNGSSWGIQIDYTDDAEVLGNSFDRSGYDTSGTVDDIYGLNSNRPRVGSNKHIFTSGGTGVTLRAINFASTVVDADIYDTDLSLATAPTVNKLTTTGTTPTLRRTRYSTDPMRFELTTEVQNSGYVYNGNVQTDSIFALLPKKGTGAAVHMSATYVEAAPDVAGQVRVTSGAAPATSATYILEIL